MTPLSAKKRSMLSKGSRSDPLANENLVDQLPAPNKPLLVAYITNLICTAFMIMPSALKSNVWVAIIVGGAYDKVVLSLPAVSISTCVKAVMSHVFVVRLIFIAFYGMTAIFLALSYFSNIEPAKLVGLYTDLFFLLHFFIPVWDFPSQKRIRSSWRFLINFLFYKILGLSFLFFYVVPFILPVSIMTCIFQNLFFVGGGPLMILFLMKYQEKMLKSYETMVIVCLWSNLSGIFHMAMFFLPSNSDVDLPLCFGLLNLTFRFEPLASDLQSYICWAYLFFWFFMSFIWTFVHSFKIRLSESSVDFPFKKQMVAMLGYMSSQDTFVDQGSIAGFMVTVCYSDTYKFVHLFLLVLQFLASVNVTMKALESITQKKEVVKRSDDDFGKLTAEIQEIGSESLDETQRMERSKIHKD